MALLSIDKGSLNILRVVRLRARGSGTLILLARPEDLQTTQTLVALTLSAAPGQDLTRQCNFTNEKVSVSFGTNEVDGFMTVDRVDEFGKKMFAARPQ
jgi:hypothetical protein